MRKIYESYEPETGITEQVFHDEMTKKTTIRRLQDVEGVIADNKKQFNLHGNKQYNDSDGLHKVATIPLMVIEKWIREGFNWYESTDAERRKKLNDPDNRYLLVRPGKL